MAVDRANFGKLMEPGLREVFFEEYDSRPEVYSRVFRVESSEKKTETDQRIAGLGTWDEKAEGSDITYEDILNADEVTYTHKTYAKGIQVTEEMMEDEQYGLIRKLTREMGRGARILVETKAADVFNNGFSSSYTGYDDKALFADDHPNRGAAGGTQDNKTTDALTDSNLKSAIIAAEKQKDEAGKLIQVKINQLIVPLDLRFTAAEILRSTGKAGTADNDANTLRDEGIELIAWAFLSDENNWFLRDSSVAQNIFFWRVRPSYKSQGDFDSGNGKFKGRMRFSTGWSDWRGLYGAEVA